MQGVKSWLKVYVLEVAPYLLDIDNHACRHMQKIVENVTNYLIAACLETISGHIYQFQRLSRFPRMFEGYCLPFVNHIL